MDHLLSREHTAFQESTLISRFEALGRCAPVPCPRLYDDLS